MNCVCILITTSYGYKLSFQNVKGLKETPWKVMPMSNVLNL